MNLNCREHGEAPTICHLNWWIIWAFSLHPSIIWKQNCWQFILKLAQCGAGGGHLIGVFSRDNGEVRVNKLQQRQIKNIWLINSSVQCGGGARHGSPACPHTTHRCQHWLLLRITIKISDWAEYVPICPLSLRTMDTIHHPLERREM